MQRSPPRMDQGTESLGRDSDPCRGRLPTAFDVRSRAHRPVIRSCRPAGPADAVATSLACVSDDHEAIAELMTSATMEELMNCSEEDLCKTIGQVARATTDPDGPGPQQPGLHNAARYLVQVRRVAGARYILDKARRDEFEPDYLTGTGSGHFILYLRSFAAEHEMPALRLDHGETRSGSQMPALRDSR